MLYTKLPLSCFLFALFLQVNTAMAQKGYEIKIDIADATNETLFLAHYFADKQYVKDTIVLDANGRGAFKGTDALKGGVYLVVFENRNYFELMIDKEQHFALVCKKANPIATLKIKGSRENELFLEYVQFLNKKNLAVETLRNGKSEEDLKKEPLLSQLNALNQEVAAFRNAFLEKNPNLFFTILLKAGEDPQVPAAPLLPSGLPDSTFGYWYFRNHYFDNFDLGDHRLLRSPIYHSRLMFYLEKLIPPVPDTISLVLDRLIAMGSKNEETFRYLVSTLASHYERSEIMGMDAVFVHLVNQYYRTRKANWVDEATLVRIIDRADMLQPNLIGKKAPPLTMPNIEQKATSLYALKSKLTIVYFWDSSCGHCKKVTPEIKKLYDKYKQFGLAVYAVSLEQERENWLKYIGENNLNFINVIDVENRTGFRRLYDISATPVIFLLDADKKILGKKLTAEQTEDFIKRLLNID